jgi:trimethylamine--corrinoid protein Co-methyltransferase
VSSTPLAGATGPVTLAGELVLQNAENLAGVVLAQILTPGIPVIYAPRLPPMDLRTSIPLVGSIEFGLMQAAAAEIAQHYGLPTDINGPGSDSKTTDEQSAFERAFTTMLPALAGANILNGIGLIESMRTQSLEQTVIDNDILGIVHRAIRGIDVDDGTLALDVLRRVGPGGHFLGEKHTHEYHLREHHIPKLCDRRDRSSWQKLGGRDIIQIGREEVRRILKHHRPSPLDRDIIGRMRAICHRAEKAMARTAQ